MTDTATITRFNTTVRPATDEADEREVVRFFAKRSLIGETDVEEIVIEDWEAALTAYIAEAPRSVEDAIEFLQTEASDEDTEEGDDEDGDEGGSVVPEEYRRRYGVEQNCGDAIAVALTAYVTLPRANKKDIDGGLDRAKLRGVAEVNGIADRLAGWEDEDLNGGLLRMNVSNVLRGMNRRGEQVTIGEQVWAADPSKMEARKARRAAARKAARAAKAAAKA